MTRPYRILPTPPRRLRGNLLVGTPGAHLDKTLTGPPTLRPIHPTRVSELAARGGRARNVARAQQREPTLREQAKPGRAAYHLDVGFRRG